MSSPGDESAPKDYQLLEQTIQVRERLTAIETRISEADFAETRRTANKALAMSEDNATDISEIKDNNRWLYRTMVGVIIAIVLKFFYDLVLPIVS